MVITEADTCRKYILKALYAAEWTDDQINEQKTFTDGRILFFGTKARRGKQKRADYLLRYCQDFPIAIVEAKAYYKHASEGLQQAKDYAEILGLKFAYSTNGKEIVEFDYTTGEQRELLNFPTPSELWKRLRETEGIKDERVLTPAFPDKSKPLRYYQEISVNRAVQAILHGRKRCLLTLCTGAGKTAVAFQIAWKLWSCGWNKRGDNRKPKILFLADRNFLVDDPMAKDFSPFGDARFKIQGGKISKGRDIYFAIYQAIAKDENRPGLYREYAKDFFDLIIVDECHRGSARDDSNWREILEWFEPAYQLGMTATPLREDNRDTYNYFGAPLYTYSLAQGIADGFLAPYRVHRVITDYDATGWRPDKGQLDRYGREIPDVEYGTKDFERVVALRARTEAIAHHLTEFLKATDRFAKTIVFCVDQEHALEMRDALARLNADLLKNNPDYVCRVTSNEGDVGAGHRAKFQDIDTQTPVILTSSQLLTTGVDAPTCKNIVLARVVGSMPEFKQIIGRGTRLRADKGKLGFNILDYTGTATQKFADPDFDGDPVTSTTITIDVEGEVVVQDVPETTEAPLNETKAWDIPDQPNGTGDLDDDSDGMPRKFYVDGGQVEVIRHIVYELDAEGNKLSCKQLTDYTAEKLRSLYPDALAFRANWLDSEKRTYLLEQLEERGIDAEGLAETLGKPEVDPFDLLCHLAYNAPLRTRRERAERLRKEEKDFFDRFGPEAHEVLNALLDKYAEHGTAQFKLPDALEVPPINEYGNVIEISRRFGGAQHLRQAISDLNERLYSTL
jgi:type I restriction enzyme R subunit